MKRGRGRPKGSGHPGSGLSSVKELSAEVVVVQGSDVRGRLHAPLVEIARRKEGSVLSQEEKILFLRVCAALRRSDDIRVRVGSAWEHPRCISLAATLCDISEKAAHNIHAQFQKEKTLPTESKRGQYVHKLELDQIFAPELLLSWVRQIVCRNTAQKRRSNYERITSELRDVVREYLDEQLLGEQPKLTDNDILLAITYGKVRRWCKQHGYHNNMLTKYMQKSKLVDSAKARACAAAFASALIQRADDPSTVFIGLDESYVDEHHARSFGVCNLEDAETVPAATKKGKRECICGAICSTANFTIAGELSQLDPLHAKKVLWHFCPNLDNRQKIPQDYHKSFDNENFLDWFMNDMVPAAERAFPGKKLTIVMDNASYHKFATFVVSVPSEDGVQPKSVRVKRDSNKDVLIQFIRHHRGEDAATPSMLKVQLMAIFDEIVTALGCDAVRFCRERQPVAHEILFTPPRFSEWQPIELFWAAVKNDVARQWEAGRGMVRMREQLMAALNRWGDPNPNPDIPFCGKLWRKCIGLVRSYEQLQRQADDDDDCGVVTVHSGDMNDDRSDEGSLCDDGPSDDDSDFSDS